MAHPRLLLGSAPFVEEERQEKVRLAMRAAFLRSPRWPEALHCAFVGVVWRV